MEVTFTFLQSLWDPHLLNKILTPHGTKLSAYGFKIGNVESLLHYIFCRCIQTVRLSLYFDVLLTVHLSIILVINQLDAQNLVL